MGTKSYAIHQLNYFKHVNMQEAHRNEYYTNNFVHLHALVSVTGEFGNNCITLPKCNFMFVGLYLGT